MKLQGNILLLILALVLLATCTHATNVRIAGKPPNTINKEAVKIVLEEQSQHAAIENYYISQMDVMQDRMEAKQQSLRQQIVQKAERKETVSIALQLATCSKKRKDEDEIKDCQDAIRKKFLGPKPVFGVAPPKEPEDFAKKETVLKTDDPKLLKRVLQIYASKRESLNLLKSELNLVQGLAKLLTGEALEDELEVKIESAALLANSRRQSREVIKMIMEKPVHKLVNIAMKPEIIPPTPPPRKNATIRGPTPWEIYQAKLQYAAYNDTEGLGPNEWNPTRGDRMDHEPEAIDERDENYDTQP